MVRAKQERTGILYSDIRKLQSPEDAVAAFGSLFENAGVEHLLAVALTQSGGAGCIAGHRDRSGQFLPGCGGGDHEVCASVQLPGGIAAA